LYKGAQKKGKGRSKKYDGKVTFNDFSRWELVKEIEPDILLYTLVLNSPRFKRDIQVVCLMNQRNAKKIGYTLLFSTDLALPALDILNHYKARFQIEFIFRDAKQFTGLSECQARKKEALDFHFNTALSVLNIIKKQDRDARQNTLNKNCSIASWKTRYFNKHLLERFILNLDLKPTLIKNNPRYQELCNYGVIEP
jgi:hypothetical protein